mmetsp:Transcript_8120/g.18099  ORF Transcript_8120/g.18099 Transcript_8120/m.18099 type:complete len:214 (+) Transcript_8120:1151-1792(+)
MPASPPSLAARHSSPHVSNARVLISSPMVKSKTGSSACAVCATKGAYNLPNSSTKVWTVSTAFCMSSLSEVKRIMSFGLPSSPCTTVMSTSSSSLMLPLISAFSSLGAMENFSRMPGKTLGTNWTKSAFIVQQIRCEAAIMYSLTGSLLGKLGIEAACTIARMISSASARNPAVPTAFAKSDIHSKAFPNRVRSSTLWSMVCTICFKTGMRSE